MKTELALIILALGVFFINALPFAEEELLDEDLQRALDEHRDAVQMDESKRTLPTNIYDTLNGTCCQYMKSKGLCSLKAVYNICHYTCGCWNVLSKDSCRILQTYNRCNVTIFKTYCAQTCKYCPHLVG